MNAPHVKQGECSPVGTHSRTTDAAACMQLYFRAAVARSQGLGGAEGDGASHELEALLDAVRTFAVEAAKHAHLAATQRRFDDTAHELQRLLSQRRRAGHLLRR